MISLHPATAWLITLTLPKADRIEMRC
jgi:hypothetical protein